MSSTSIIIREERDEVHFIDNRIIFSVRRYEASSFWLTLECAYVREKLCSFANWCCPLVF